MSDRISFGRLHDALDIPDLIQIQTKSFDDFLQPNLPPDKREYKGFQEVFKDIFSSDINENSTGLEFLSYEIEPPKVGIVDCLKDGGTYQSSIYANFRLRLSGQKETKEERVHLGEMPIMTERGSFVINGAERVIVSQLHRSPGVCFEKMRHASGKELFSYKIIADHGSWLEVQYDNNDYIYIYLDRKRRRRKFLISTFLRAFGYQTDRELLNAVYGYFYLMSNCQRIQLDDKDRVRIKPLFGAPLGNPSQAEEDLLAADDKKLPRWLGVRDVPVDELMAIEPDELAHIYTAEDVLNPMDEELPPIVEGLASLTDKALYDAKDNGIDTIAVVDTNGMGDTFIRCIQKEHRDFGKMPTPDEARKEIYRRMRPSDQATDNNAKALFMRLFEDVRRYDIGRVGRYRIFKRLFLSPLTDLDDMLSDDEKMIRQRFNKITLEELRSVIGNFQCLLLNYNPDAPALEEDQQVLRLLFSTPEYAFSKLFYDGPDELDMPKEAKDEILPFVRSGYRKFLGAVKTEDTIDTAGGVLAAFLETNMEGAQGCVRRACAKILGVKDDAKNARENEGMRKTVATVLEKVSKMKRSDLRKLLCGGYQKSKSDSKTAKLTDAVYASVCYMLREVVKEVIVQVQDFLKSRRYLTKADIAASTAYLMRLKEGACVIDDIDHLGRRRVRTIGELLQNQCRVGLSRMASAFREKLNGQSNGAGTSLANQNIEDVSIARALNTKVLMSVVKDFFSRNQLSQFMDQTNALAELTNKRRLSALGPGGLTRERAGFEVRDVHSSHYGRVCPIETPEGPNIGLISSLALYAQIDEFGFINTPYRRVSKCKVSDDIEYLTADREEDFVIAQANAPQDADNMLIKPYVWARLKGESNQIERERVNYIDVSPKQLISAATGLIPFLEHDDANRALMGSNMQRQAVPLLKAERPIVGTGLEEPVARYSRAAVNAREAGIVASSDAERIIITKDGKMPNETAYPDEVQVYNLYKFLRSNASTLVNQQPIVVRGQAIEKGQAIADGACTDQGELALGRNVTVAFMSWHGYNFEDAIIISERLVMSDAYTSIHLSMEDVVARDTKLGPEEITRDIPNVGEEALRNLDSEGVVRIGAEVKPDDILVGKITPKNESDLPAEERLLKAIFGEKAQDVKDSSLRVPGGLYGIVMDVRIERKSEPSTKAKGDGKDSLKAKIKEKENKYKQEHDNILDEMVRNLGETFLGQKLPCSITRTVAGEPEEIITAERKITKSMLHKLALNYDSFNMRDCPEKEKIEEIIRSYRGRLRDNEQCRQEAIEKLEQGDGQELGKIRSVKVYIASKRRISVGDKMAGRHGNKGIVAKIVPVEDMPFMADGTPVDIILNPLGVPSRMNIGQVFETHVGWAAGILGMTVATPVFDGIRERCKDEDKEKVQDYIKTATIPSTEEVKKFGVVDLLELSRAVKVKEKGWIIDEEGHVRDNEGVNRDEYFVGGEGKIRLYDGRTGEPFTQRIMVGKIYMLKLDHLVANKIHARATGTYSLVTQQPLGGKAQHGGQRFGEMEVWALEAYGAAYTLQEMLTVKSDDKKGRGLIYESIIHGNGTLKASVPESFNVLLREMMGLCLDIKVGSD